MGRVIEFRGINHETGEFVHGHYTKLQDGARIYNAIVSRTDPHGGLESFYIHEEKTIGQFTELNDKNGIKIFEGDVVRFNLRGSDDLQPKYGEIGAVHITKYGPAFGGWCSEYCNTIEVIGNIHQHEHLLEKK